MKKLLCCLLATTTLFAVASASVSCGGSGASGGTSAETSYDESTVSLRLTKKAYNIENEQTVALQIEFTANGEEANPAVLNFSSSDPTIATVSDDGVVTGVSGGKAYITVSYGAKTAKATINVTMRENRITISDESLLLLVGTTKQVTAKAYYGLTELTDAELLWTTSDPAVATVDNGLITAVGNGKAEITVSYEGASKTVLVSSAAEATAEQINTFDEAYINIYGRTYTVSDGLKLDHAANGVEVGFIGTSLTVNISSSYKSKMRVFIDGDSTGKKIDLVAGTNKCTVASGLTDGLHTVRIVKGTEEMFAQWTVTSFVADKFFVIPEKSDLKIEFIGSSAASGYGIYGTPGQEGTIENSDSSRSYAYLAAHELNADYSIVARTGISVTAKFWAGDDNMENLYGQISATNKQAYAFDFNPDIIVLNLGSVESSYISRPHDGDPSYASNFMPDYQRFLEKVRAKNPNAYIICLYGMINKNPAIHNGIRLSVEALNDDRIVYNPFEIKQNNDGAINHPSSVANKTWGADLAAYIKTLDL